MKQPRDLAPVSTEDGETLNTAEVDVFEIFLNVHCFAKRTKVFIHALTNISYNVKNNFSFSLTDQQHIESCY